MAAASAEEKQHRAWKVGVTRQSSIDRRKNDLALDRFSRRAHELSTRRTRQLPSFCEVQGSAAAPDLDTRLFQRATPQIVDRMVRQLEVSSVDLLHGKWSAEHKDPLKTLLARLRVEIVIALNPKGGKISLEQYVNWDAYIGRIVDAASLCVLARDFDIDMEVLSMMVVASRFPSAPPPARTQFYARVSEYLNMPLSDTTWRVVSVLAFMCQGDTIRIDSSVESVSSRLIHQCGIISVLQKWLATPVRPVLSSDSVEAHLENGVEMCAFMVSMLVIDVPSPFTEEGQLVPEIRDINIMMLVIVISILKRMSARVSNPHLVVSDCCITIRSALWSRLHFAPPGQQTRSLIPVDIVRDLMNFLELSTRFMTADPATLRIPADHMKIGISSLLALFSVIMDGSPAEKIVVAGSLVRVLPEFVSHCERTARRGEVLPVGVCGLLNNLSECTEGMTEWRQFLSMVDRMLQLQEYVMLIEKGALCICVANLVESCHRAAVADIRAELVVSLLAACLGIQCSDVHLPSISMMLSFLRYSKICPSLSLKVDQIVEQLYATTVVDVINRLACTAELEQVRQMAATVSRLLEERSKVKGVGADLIDAMML